jgi:hypothetical protein
MSDEVKVSYGLCIENGVETFVHISEIDAAVTGLKCNCICPACKTKLQVKLPRNDPNFTPDLLIRVLTNADMLLKRQYISKRKR